MKKRVVSFLCLALLVLAIVPAYNLKWGDVQKKPDQLWWHRAVLYNMDFAARYSNRVLYAAGISTDPGQVMIGRQGWLYLGDQYEQTLSVMRRAVNADDAQRADRIAVATKAWQQWFAEKGVHATRIILGANKNSVYPEFSPAWARPAASTVSDSLLGAATPGLYVDTRPALLAAKAEFPQALYYKTDTHWNALGGWVAYRALAAQLAAAEPGLHWLTQQQVSVAKVIQRDGGDLANFLKLSKSLADEEVEMRIAGPAPIETEQYDYDSGRLIASGGNPPIVAPRLPLLVKSPNALNQKKVLWLRDSFGTVMSSYMAATFSETLQLHFGLTDAAMVARLVERYRPDYVFITTVERDSRGAWFEQIPPLMATARPAGFTPMARATETTLNDVVAIAGEKKYRVSGIDPFVMFSVTPALPALRAPVLAFRLGCDNKTEPVRLQVFWNSAGGGPTEANSARFMAVPGSSVINLGAVPAWRQGGPVTGLRIDLDLAGSCSVFAIEGVELGV